jgi:hypothetical protein
VRPMYRVSAAFAAFSFVLLVPFMAPPAHAQEPVRQEKAGIRGRVVVEPELLAATERPVDAIRAEALETSAHVRRPRGRRLLPMMAAMPDLAVVIQGEDVRVDSPSPKTVVIEGMRFVPGQVLLTRPGAIAIENRQAQTLTVMGKSGALATIAAGETKQVALSSDKEDQVLSLKELPFARAVAKVLDRGLAVPFDANGDMPFTPLVEGEYSISFWMGSELLYGPTPFQVKRNRTSYIDATISANSVVTVAVKDASMFVAVPVAQPVVPPSSEP